LGRRRLRQVATIVTPDTILRWHRLGGSDFFVQAEAMFALWDMQVREREVPGAVATARMLARDFPENRELRRFLTIHAPTAAMISPDHNAP